LIELRELRREVSPEEDLSVGPEEEPPARGKEADWPKIVVVAQEALQTRTKDLEIAALLTEAWMRIHGFRGLAAGLTLVRELSERYWDHLHPGIEDGELVAPIRSKHYSWIGSSRAFQQSVMLAPLFPRSGSAPLTWYDHNEARRLEQLRLTAHARWQEATKEDKLSIEAFHAAVDATAASEQREILDAVERSRLELRMLETFTDKQFDSDDAPLLLQLRNLLDEIDEFLRRRLGGEPATSPAPASGSGASEESAPITPEPVTSVDTPRPGPIQSRQDALRRLGELAEFFRRTEPHSPVSYLVQRALRWCDMPLDALLKEVVKDPSVLNQIWDTLGILPPEE